MQEKKFNINHLWFILNTLIIVVATCSTISTIVHSDTDTACIILDYLCQIGSDICLKAIVPAVLLIIPITLIFISQKMIEEIRKDELKNEQNLSIENMISDTTDLLAENTQTDEPIEIDLTVNEPEYTVK